jgi:REP element-mobilizing transposase RayT
MGREPRSYDTEGIYHLTTHGIDDRPIFRDDIDRQDFAIRLRRIALRERWRFYAVCLMDTHYHLILRPALGRVSNGMRDLNSGHSRTFNARHVRRGALFEARYRDKPIDDEEHLSVAVHYVEFNPVTAGLVDDVRDWPWSTYSGSALRSVLAKCLTPEVSDAS